MSVFYKDTVKLFGVVVVEDISRKRVSDVVLKETSKRGFVFDPVVMGNYTDQQLLLMTKDLGLTPQQLNSGFHKAFETVRDTPYLVLFFQQILHYFSTYGAEDLGIYDEKLVYVPIEDLEIPELTRVPVRVIHGVPASELKALLFQLLSAGVALSEDTLSSVSNLLPLFLTPKDIERVSIREVRTMCYRLMGVVPSDPVEFLRYVVFTATGKTLLIKTKETFAFFKSRSNTDLVPLFQRYERDFGLSPLASVFYRFKPLFLAMRTNPYLRSKINKIRKLAPKFHKPFEPSYLDVITPLARRGALSLEALKKELGRANIFRKIRLCLALRYYSHSPKSIVYRIRNGKAFATRFNSLRDPSALQDSLILVSESIVEDLKPRVFGKVFLIPRVVDYGLPSSEKQFLGNFPFGTTVKVNEHMIVGVHWFNKDGRRVDLDLSFIGRSFKLGWDSQYYTDEKDLIFSGDLTDAPEPEGAIEAIFVKGSSLKLLVMLNFYNASYFSDGEVVPFRLIISDSEPLQSSGQCRNYLIDPNRVVCSAESDIGAKQLVLGLVDAEERRFYFAPMMFGTSITSFRGSKSSLFLDYFETYIHLRLSFVDFITQAGAIVIREPLEGRKVDFDLSPEKLSKSSFLTLLTD